MSALFLAEALAFPFGCRTDLTILLTPVKAQAFFCFDNIHSTGVNVNMEIAKFVLSCVGSFISVSAFFMGIWKAYSKKMEDKIKAIQQQADEKTKEAEAHAQTEIDKVREGSIAKSEKLEKRIAALEKNVSDLQRDVNLNLGQRLSNIEGEMKGMNNILKQIQGWFINNTPRG